MTPDASLSNCPTDLDTTLLTRGCACARYLLIVLLIAVSVAAYALVRLVDQPFLRSPETGRHVINDPDSAMHWRLVVRAIRGEDVRIRWMDEDNVPAGRLNEWPSPMTMLGVAGVRLTQWVGGVDEATALDMAPLWIAPVLGLLTGLAVMGIVWRLAGWQAGMGAILAWPVLQHIFINSQMGYFDHHMLHQLVTVLLYGGIVVFRRSASRGGAVLIGVLATLGVWSSSTEFMFILPPVVWLAIVDVTRPEADTPVLVEFWRVAWISGLVSTAAALVWEFWPAPLHTQLELLSVWHVALWAVVGVLLELLGRYRPRWQVSAVAAVAAVGVLVLVAGAMKGFDFAHMHVLQDSEARRCISMTAEFLTIGASEGVVKTLWSNFGLLILGLLVAGTVYRQSPRGEKFLLFATLLIGEMALWQVRWMGFFTPLLVMVTALALRRWLVGRAWLVPVLMAVATIGPWMAMAGVVRQARACDWQADHPGAPYAHRLMVERAIEALPEGRPGVLAPLRMSSFIGGSGRARVVGSPYWSNTAGMFRHFEIYSTTDPARLAELLREHQVEYILVSGKPEVREESRLAVGVMSGTEPPTEPDTAIIRYIKATQRPGYSLPAPIIEIGGGWYWLPTGISPAARDDRFPAGLSRDMLSLRMMIGCLTGHRV